MKATRTKRMAGFVGLLMALALTAGGCAPAQPPAGGNAPAVSGPEATPVAKISSMKLIKDTDFEGWNSMDGETDFKWSAADVASMEKNGTAALEILSQRHPEFTVEGFKPTPEIWSNTVAAELKPLTTTEGWATLSRGWAKEVPSEDAELSGNEVDAYVTNPFLTNRPEILDSAKYPIYSVTRAWKTPAGEKCSPSDKPYEVNPVGVSATTRPEGNSFASAYPIITAMLEVKIHCKEGGVLKVDQMSLSLLLKKEGGQWLVDRVNMFAPSTPNVMEK